MRRRELRVVKTEERLGSVGLTDENEPFFTGGAEELFRGRIRDQPKAMKQLLDDGWSNGYLYLADEKGK